MRGAAKRSSTIPIRLQRWRETTLARKDPMETHETEMMLHEPPIVAPIARELALRPLRSSEVPLPTLTEVAHEARNMVTMLGLYCELLDQPGVLSSAYQHYGSELKMVAAASRSLVERLAGLERQNRIAPEGAAPRAASAWLETAHEKLAPGDFREGRPLSPITDFAWELQSNRNLLAALAGPSIALHVDVAGGACAVALSSEDLTRILVNLVKNSVEAMPGGGRIQLILRQSQTSPSEPTKLILNIEDNGSGIPTDALESVFAPGFTTRTHPSAGAGQRRGLGLAITRSIVEAAGGHLRAANRDPHGACFQVELPIRSEPSGAA
jgi:signal transduction histidine kinase